MGQSNLCSRHTSAESAILSLPLLEHDVSEFRRYYLEFLRSDSEKAFDFFVRGVALKHSQIPVGLQQCLKRLHIASEVDSSGEHLECLVRLFSFHGLLIATDRLWYLEPSLAEGMVMPMHPENSIILKGLSPHKGARVLDIGFGIGVFGLAALKQGAGSLLGLDVTQRALRFATFNALLNQVASDAYEWRINPVISPSEIFAGIEGERFDLILCNPPFEVGRDNEEFSVTLANGGADGLAYFRAILPQMHRYLSLKGEAHLVFFSVGDERGPLGIRRIAETAGGEVTLEWVENSLSTTDFVRWNTGETRNFDSEHARLWFGRITVRPASTPRLVCNTLPAVENWHWPLYSSTPIGVNLPLHSLKNKTRRLQSLLHDGLLEERSEALSIKGIERRVDRLRSPRSTPRTFT